MKIISWNQENVDKRTGLRTGEVNQE